VVFTLQFLYFSRFSPTFSANSPTFSSHSQHASEHSPDVTSSDVHTSANSPHVSSNSPHVSSHSPHFSSHSPHVSSNSPDASAHSPQVSANSPQVSSNSLYRSADELHVSSNEPASVHHPEPHRDLCTDLREPSSGAKRVHGALAAERRHLVSPARERWGNGRSSAIRPPNSASARSHLPYCDSERSAGARRNFIARSKRWPEA
jgi:hypothetical protein